MLPPGKPYHSMSFVVPDHSDVDVPNIYNPVETIVGESFRAREEGIDMAVGGP